jgi:hypothetical protein
MFRGPENARNSVPNHSRKTKKLGIPFCTLHGRENRTEFLNPSWNSNINWEVSNSSNATATGTPTRVWTLATTETTSTDDFFGLLIVKVAF